MERLERAVFDKINSREGWENNILYHAGKNIEAEYTRKELREDFDLFPKIAERQGFDGLPSVLPTEELEAYMERHDLPALYHGDGGTPADVEAHQQNRHYYRWQKPF